MNVRLRHLLEIRFAILDRGGEKMGVDFGRKMKGFHERDGDGDGDGEK